MKGQSVDFFFFNIKVMCESDNIQYKASLNERYSSRLCVIPNTLCLHSCEFSVVWYGRRYACYCLSTF